MRLLRALTIKSCLSYSAVNGGTPNTSANDEILAPGPKSFITRILRSRASAQNHIKAEIESEQQLIAKIFKN